MVPPGAERQRWHGDRLYLQLSVTGAAAIPSPHCRRTDLKTALGTALLVSIFTGLLLGMARHQESSDRFWIIQNLTYHR